MIPVIQDVVVMMIPDSEPWDISSKGGNMALNLFCIDEEMANESSGIFYNKEFYDTKNFITQSTFAGNFFKPLNF